MSRKTGPFKYLNHPLQTYTIRSVKSIYSNMLQFQVSNCPEAANAALEIFTAFTIRKKNLSSFSLPYCDHFKTIKDHLRPILHPQTLAFFRG